MVRVTVTLDNEEFLSPPNSPYLVSLQDNCISFFLDNLPCVNANEFFLLFFIF